MHKRFWGALTHPGRNTNSRFIVFVFVFFSFLSSSLPRYHPLIPLPLLRLFIILIPLGHLLLFISSHDH